MPYSNIITRTNVAPLQKEAKVSSLAVRIKALGGKKK